MMDGVQSHYGAAQLLVLATDGGVHPARKWAVATASMIVKPREDASVEARAQIYNLLLQIEDILVQVFEEVKSATSPMDVMIITSQASGRIAEIASSTQWADVFAAPPIRAAIDELVRRNLASAADLALRAE